MRNPAYIRKSGNGINAKETIAPTTNMHGTNLFSLIQYLFSFSGKKLKVKSISMRAGSLFNSGLPSIQFNFPTRVEKTSESSNGGLNPINVSGIRIRLE